MLSCKNARLKVSWDYGLAAWYRYWTSHFFYCGVAPLPLMTLLLLSKHEKLPLWEIKAIKTSFAVAAFKPKCACVVLSLHITSTTIFDCHFCSCVCMQLTVYIFFLEFATTAQGFKKHQKWVCAAKSNFYLKTEQQQFCIAVWMPGAQELPLSLDEFHSPHRWLKDENYMLSIFFFRNSAWFLQCIDIKVKFHELLPENSLNFVIFFQDTEWSRTLACKIFQLWRVLLVSSKRSITFSYHLLISVFSSMISAFSLQHWVESFFFCLHSSQKWERTSCSCRLPRTHASQLCQVCSWPIGLHCKKTHFQNLQSFFLMCAR